MSRSNTFTVKFEDNQPNLSRNALPMRTPFGSSPASAMNEAEAWQDETDRGRDR